MLGRAPAAGAELAGNTASAEPGLSGVDGSPEQGKVELDFIWVSLLSSVLVGCSLQGLAFVAWSLLLGEVSEWRVWSSGWCWRRPAQEPGHFGQSSPCCAVF